MKNQIAIVKIIVVLLHGLNTTRLDRSKFKSITVDISYLRVRAAGTRVSDEPQLCWCNDFASVSTFKV